MSSPRPNTKNKLDLMVDAIIEFIEIKKLTNDIFKQKNLPNGIWAFVDLELKKKGVETTRSPGDYIRYKDYVQNQVNIKIIKETTQPSLTPSEHSEPSLHEELINRNDIVKLINEVMDKRLSDLKESVQMIQNKMEMPPETKTVKGSGRGRKETRDYVKITPTVDRILFNLFDADAKKRKISQGKMLDIILWHWYEKPKLSYEE